MKDNQKQTKLLQVAFIMDVMEQIADDDTSVSIMVEAQKRGHTIFYIEPRELVYRDNSVYANVREVSVTPTPTFRILKRKWLDLKTCDVIFNRKEPPFDLSYLYLTHMLELLEPDVFIINSPRGVRKANEKLYILKFPYGIPPTIVSNDPNHIEVFQRKNKMDLILKPLDQKGGRGIRLLPWKTKKARQILKQVTRGGTKWVMAQEFLKRNLTEGDKRILVLNGIAIGQFGRVPKRGEFRANMALGGEAIRAALTDREKKLVRSMRPKLIRDGLYFVGLDVVDGQLIEINVTSPAGIPEINALEGTRLETQVVDFLEKMALGRSFSS